MKHRFLFLALCACVLACDSASPVAPTGSVLSVNANPSQIGLSGSSSQITVTGFKPDGNPLNPGTQILISADFGNLYDASTGGNLISTIEVGGNGRALAYLRGDGRTGSATVTATLATGGDVTSSTTVQIGVAAGDVPTLLLTASPSVVNLNETSIISALARSADGTPVGAGQQVRLRTSLGTLDSQTLVTNSTGEAQTTLRPGTITGTATVTGTVGASAEAMVTVTFGESAENRPTLTLTANPEAVSPGDTSAITAQARSADGSPLANATVVLRTSLGELDRTSGNTSSSGQAGFTLMAGNQSGDAVVTGSVGSSDEVSVTVTIGQPVLLINANPSTIDVNEMSTITVTARGSNGTPLANREVLLTADLGILDDDSPLTDETGRATAIYTAGTQAGMGSVNALLGSSEQVTATIQVRTLPAAIILDVSPTASIPPGADTTLTFSATVTDAEGQLLVNEVVTFSIETGVVGTFNPSSTVTTDTSGRASTDITFESSGIPSSGETFQVFASVRGVETPAEVTITVQ